MENRLQSQIQEAIDEFTTMTSQITPSSRRVASSKDKKTNVNQNMIKNALKKICPKGKSKVITSDFITHYQNLEKLIPFCSSPKSISFSLGFTFRDFKQV